MTATHQPQVTLVCLSWNHEGYIEQCFESILKQTYPNLELVYIDNHSSDATYEKGLAVLKKADFPCRYEKRDRNFSITKNFNFALNHFPVGELFCLLSTDDWLGPDAVKNKVERWLKEQDLALVYSNPVFYIEDTDTYVPPSPDGREGYVFDDLLLGNFISAPGILVHTETARKYGFFDEAMLIDDWDLWLRMLQQHRIGFVADDQVYYRRHSSNFSRGYSPEFLKEVERILSKYKDHKNYSKALKCARNKYLGSVIASKGLSAGQKMKEFLRYRNLSKGYVKANLLLWRRLILGY